MRRPARAPSQARRASRDLRRAAGPDHQTARRARGASRRARRDAGEKTTRDRDTRAARSDARDAVRVAARPALLDDWLGFPVETFEHSFDHAGVDRAEDVRVAPGGVAERA